jgi:hypothetical protein
VGEALVAIPETEKQGEKGDETRIDKSAGGEQRLQKPHILTQVAKRLQRHVQVTALLVCPLHQLLLGIQMR